MPGFAEVLNTLFERHPNGRNGPYSNDYVAKWASERGVKMSGTHLWNMRKVEGGHDPRASHIKILGEFFDYPPGYFIDPAVYWETERRLGYAEDDQSPAIPGQSGGKSSVLLRQVEDLQPETRAVVASLIEHVSNIEGRRGASKS